MNGKAHVNTCIGNNNEIMGFDILIVELIMQFEYLLILI